MLTNSIRLKILTQKHIFVKSNSIFSNYNGLSNFHGYPLQLLGALFITMFRVEPGNGEVVGYGIEISGDGKTAGQVKEGLASSLLYFINEFIHCSPLDY